VAPAAGSTVSQLIAARARAVGVDPRAALAVAGQEGLSGGIGDYGTSFGPFQLHYGGAFPSWAPRSSPQASQAWAESPAGVNYALGQIAGVARGLTGRQAVTNIVTRFERPAAPGPEAARAWANYGGTGVPTAPAVASAAPATAAAAPAVHTGANTQAFSNALLAGIRANGGTLTPATLITALRAGTAHLRG
jgi:hypothetical protein